MRRGVQVLNGRDGQSRDASGYRVRSRDYIGGM